MGTTWSVPRAAAVREAFGPRPAARVLVVDDDDEMRALLRRTLEFDGYEVIDKDRGTHAMEALRGAPFDLIILDKEMPGLTGFDLLPILGREFPDVPVVLVTAFGGPHVAASAVRLGAASYLEKPFRLGQLRQVIDGLLTRSTDDSRAS
jgi:DNA-binding NtrC family response regulator